MLFRALEESGQEGAQALAEEFLTQVSGVRDVDIQGGLANVVYAAALGFIVGGKVSAVAELATGVATQNGVSSGRAQRIVEALAGNAKQLQEEGAGLLKALRSNISFDPKDRAAVEETMRKFVSGEQIDVNAQLR